MFCDSFLELTISEPFHINLLRLIIGLFYILMMNVTVVWIYHQKRSAEKGDNVAVESVIFPLFINIMWVLAISDFFIGMLIILVPVNVHENVTKLALALYPLGYACQHAVLEGVAFLLLQKGCGYYGSRQAGQYTFIWSLITAIVLYLRYAKVPQLSEVCFLLWCFCLVVFYLLIWILPSNLLYRRAAVIPYAKFWFFYRLLMFLFLVIIYLRPITSNLVESVGQCGYDLIYLLLYPLIHPLVLYRTLLNDSRWWQGIAFHLQDSTSDAIHKGTVRAPLLGVDLSQHSAQVLARVVDNMGGKQTANLLNFAEIRLDRHKMLGHGSFSKVYRGAYRNMPCAIKLVFTSDLTEEVILRAEAEATLLSSIKSLNIVNILGVSVLPPSVCIVLELCAYGSLSDVLRGDSGPLKKSRLSLSLPDRLFLALGCARGVAALHSLGKDVVHRDIKSYNFLVDGQLNAKLADLELGSDSTEEDIDDSPFQKDFLVNWVPPEVLRGELYTQSSDIYSLSLVLWEIISGKIPYLDPPVPPSARIPNSNSFLNLNLQQQQQQSPAQPPPQNSFSATFSTLTKNFSFQSLAGLSTQDASIHHGYSQQSTDTRKHNSNYSSIRNQILSGYRPEIPLCPREYVELIKSGWNSDRYIRPRASDLVIDLEKLWIGCYSSNLASLEESFDIYQSIDEFLLTEEGKEYVRNVLNFRNRAVDIFSLSFSQTLSLFGQFSKNIRSISLPNFKLNPNSQDKDENEDEVDNDNDNETKVQKDDDDDYDDEENVKFTRYSEPLLNSKNIIQNKLKLNNNNNNNNKEQKNQNNTKMTINSLYSLIQNSNIWSVVNSLSDPVVILSGQAPYFILKCSIGWQTLMGFAPEQIFGKCLEHFIPPDQLYTSPNKEYKSQDKNSRSSSNTASNTHSNSKSNSNSYSHSNSISNINGPSSKLFSGDITTYDALLLFYSQLTKQDSSHVILKLQNYEKKAFPISVHAFPLYQRQQRRFGMESEINNNISNINNNNNNQMSSNYNNKFKQLQQPLSSHYNSDAKNVISYYVVYMNQLTSVQNNPNDLLDEENPERTYSTMSRVISAASSSISHSIRMSWLSVTSTNSASGKNYHHKREKEPKIFDIFGENDDNDDDDDDNEQDARSESSLL